MRSTFLRRIGLLVAGVAVATNCGLDEPPTTRVEQFEQYDSAGVIVLETSGSAARRPVGWTVDPAPNLQIGRIDEEGPEQFHRIAGVRRLPDNRLLVVDGGSAELRFFDPDGAFMYARGGKGRAPGEFQSAALVPAPSTNSMYLFDSRLRRFTIVDSAGMILRVVRSAQSAGQAVGVVGSRVLMRYTVLRMIQRTALIEDTATYVISDLSGGDGDTVGDLEGRGRFVLAEGSIPTSFGVPFDVMPSAAASSFGFYITEGEEPSIIEYDTLGQVKRIIRVDEPTRRVTREDVERYVAEQVASVTVPEAVSFRTRAFEQMPIPETMPAFQSLVVDDVGWLWAELYRPLRSDPAIWMVFDPAGQAQGTVELPAGLEVQQIGLDFVLGRWRDDLDVEYVRRHRLQRVP